MTARPNPVALLKGDARADKIVPPSGLTANLLVLNIVPDAERLELMCRQIEKQLGHCSYQLFQTFPEFAAPWRPPELNHGFLECEWARAGYSDFLIDER